jgi:hypothetical protein
MWNLYPICFVFKCCVVEIYRLRAEENVQFWTCFWKIEGISKLEYLRLFLAFQPARVSTGISSLNGRTGLNG